MIKLISWNVNGRTGEALDKQADAIRSQSPHLLCLQEVTKGSEPPWRARLEEVGLEHIETSVGLVGAGRRYANLLASRWPLTLMPPSEFEIPYPEKVLSAVVAAPAAAFELHNAHLPPGSTRPLEKLATFEGIFERLARRARRPRLLCGDFYTPRAEQRDGTVVTWASKKHGGLRQRWEEAEGSVLIGLRDHDLNDAYRALHAYISNPTSYLPNGPNPAPRRYDHIYVSKALMPCAAAIARTV